MTPSTACRCIQPYDTHILALWLRCIQTTVLPQRSTSAGGSRRQPGSLHLPAKHLTRWQHFVGTQQTPPLTQLLRAVPRRLALTSVSLREVPRPLSRARALLLSLVLCLSLCVSPCVSLTLPYMSVRLDHAPNASAGSLPSGGSRLNDGSDSAPPCGE
eukprot:COSAG03_NODE_1096_length_4826_cov_49.647768_4_plen_158_part_00